MSSRCGTYLLIQIPTIPPQIKSLPASSTIFTLEDQMLHRDITLHCVRWRHALCEVPPTAVGHSSTPRDRPHDRRAPIAKKHHCQISQELNISFTGAYCAFLCASGMARPIAPLRHWGIYIVEHPTHTTKFGAWL